MAEVTYATLLDNFTKELYSGIITDENMIDVPLFEALKSNVDRASFDTNGNVKILIQTGRGRNARGLVDGGNLPDAQASSYVEQTVPVQRILAVAGLTEKTKKLLTGGSASWGPIVRRTLDDMILDFKYMQNIAAHSNGRGCLASVASSSYNATAGPGSTPLLTITCDNEYWDTGIENTSIIQKDMWIKIWDSDANGFAADSGGATEFKVVSVAPGKRSSSTWAATTGTVSVTVASDINANCADGDFLFIGGAADDGTVGNGNLPMGLTGIIANNNTGTYDDDLIAPFTTATFQGLARASYPSLCADIWHASDFSSDSDHTPSENWDLSVLSDAMDEVDNDGGKTRLIRCHPEMARCLYRLSQSNNSVNVTVNTSPEAGNQKVVGDRRPKYMLDINGDEMPIITDKYMARYAIEGIDTSVLRWHPVGNADFRKDFGDIWGPTRGGRATTIEAGYEWWYELSSERCDWHWRVNDLAII
jgi:hypothetical protein